ncbi:MAG TPA: choice-of-anchor D domain-containing protein [Candidatus Acidoferrales bacterium]|nr:choice-of-anchor D domain-containing protein [Candidatus Acidoferrales bacterium]
MPREIVVNRVAVIDPMSLPAPGSTTHRGARPLRVADPAAYLQMKSALANGSIMPLLPSLASGPSATLPEVLLNFSGLAAAESCGGCEPPDTQVAAGPSHVFEVDNVRGQIFDKSGNAMTSFDLNAFFGLNTNLFTSDPRIRFDTISGRWFVSLLSLDAADLKTSHNGFINLAVSTDSDPTHGFTAYQIETAASFPDQPALGFNEDKVVTSANAFTCSPNCSATGFQGNEFVVWNKADLLAGAMNPSLDFFGPPQDTTNSIIQPAKSRSSTSTLFMASADSSSLNIWSLDGVPGVGGGTMPTVTSKVINNLAMPPPAHQKNPKSILLDTGDTRLQDAVFRDGQLWASGDTGCVPSGDSTERSCMRFIEVTTANMSVVQDFDFGTSGDYYYYPAIDLDSADNLMTAFTRSSANEFPSAYVDARLASDPANTLGAPLFYKAGITDYTSTHKRWGDYSGAAIDPSDQSSFWVAAEFAAAGNNVNWGTWIAKATITTGSPSATPTPGLGRLRVAPQPLQFHKVAVNSFKDKTLKVKNRGMGDLHVTIGSLTPPFSVTGGGSIVIPKGQMATATITFAPNATGTASQTLVINSDDPTLPLEDLNVVGIGK